MQLCLEFALQQSSLRAFLCCINIWLLILVSATFSTTFDCLESLLQKVDSTGMGWELD